MTTATISSEQLARREVVLIVPGIRDRGIGWQTVAEELRQAGFYAQVLGWSEFFGLLPFLVPAPWLRRHAMSRLEERIKDAIQTSTVSSLLPRVSFIAHSFGSYILCHLLKRNYHLRAHRIILCGSVLGRRFKFSGFADRFSTPVLNEVGCKDRWPLLASSVTFGYGSIGTFGYFGAPVVDRFHKEAHHGYFSRPGFCTRFWIPFLQSEGDKGVVAADPPIEETTVARTLSRSLQHLKWVLLALALFLTTRSASESYCGRQAQPVESITRSGSLVWLHSAVSFERSRLEFQNESVCGYLPVNWPQRAKVVYLDKRLDRIAACTTRPSVQTGQAFAIDALSNIAKAFPECIEFKVSSSRAAVELRVAPANSSQKIVDLGSAEGEWIVCSCDDDAIAQLRFQRIGR